MFLASAPRLTRAATIAHLAPIIIYRRRGTRASAPTSNAKRDRPMHQSFTDIRKSIIPRQDRINTRISDANNHLIPWTRAIRRTPKILYTEESDASRTEPAWLPVRGHEEALPASATPSKRISSGNIASLLPWQFPRFASFLLFNKIRAEHLGGEMTP